MGYEVYPQGFAACLRDCARVGVPLYVTENGIGTDDDRQRVRYLARHLAVLHEVIRDGVDVRGYLYWSAMDNFEWVFGYTKTFGLIAVDRTDLRRIPKPSAHYYGEIATANAVDPETTARYLKA
jgi:beta-glucosidase